MLFIVKKIHPCYLCVTVIIAYTGNAPNQLSYTDIDRRWVMPSLYYSLHYNVGGQDVHLVFLDTDPIRRDSEYHQYNWFKNELGM